MFRVFSIIGLFLILLALCFYAAWKGPEQELTSWEALADPEKYQGTEIAGSYNRVIGALDQYIVVGPYGHRVNLKVTSDFEVKPYDFISYRGMVSEEGYIEVEEIYVHGGRTLKYLTSLFSFVIVALWFFHKYRFDFRRFVFKER